MKKNISNWVFNILMIICPLLGYVFLSQPYTTTKYVNLVASGYDFINFDSESAALNVNTICLIFFTLFSAILIVACVYSLIRGKKTEKIVDFVKLLSVVVLVVTSLISLICVASEMGELLVLGWAVIVNFVIALVALASYILSKLKFFNK